MAEADAALLLGHRGALEDLLHDLLGGAPVELGLGGGQQPVGQDGDGEGLDVVRQRVLPAAEGGGRLRRAQQMQRRARGGAESQVGVVRVAATRSTA